MKFHLLLSQLFGSNPSLVGVIPTKDTGTTATSDYEEAKNSKPILLALNLNLCSTDDISDSENSKDPFVLFTTNWRIRREKLQYKWIGGM